MKSNFSAVALLGFVSTINGLTIRDTQNGCGAALPEDVKPNVSIEQDLGDRRYRLHLPPGYDGKKKLPLILSFHGRTQTGTYQEKLSKFSNATYGFEGIAVYPEGVKFTTDTGSKVQQWQGDPDSKGVDDVKFTLDLISELEKKYCVDPARIYSAGKSNGGGFTGLLACDSEASKRIAAFAVVSGAFYRDNKTNELPACTPGRKSVPWMEFHGYADDTIPYVGGLNTRKNAYSTNINKYVHDWARRDDFEVSSKKTSTLCSGKRSVTRYGWGKDVIVHYNYTNLGHDWPSSYENADTKADGDSVLTCKEAEATSIILEWFKKWTL